MRGDKSRLLLGGYTTLICLYLLAPAVRDLMTSVLRKRGHAATPGPGDRIEPPNTAAPEFVSGEALVPTDR